MYFRYFQIFICLILLFAMFFELILKIQPCELCLIQRIFWILILIACFFNTKSSLLLCFILLLSNVGVSFYQFLTQMGFLNSICNINFNNLEIPCNTFDIYLFNKGISFAFINCLLGLISLVYIKKVAQK